MPICNHDFCHHRVRVQGRCGERLCPRNNPAQFADNVVHADFGTGQVMQDPMCAAAPLQHTLAEMSAKSPAEVNEWWKSLSDQERNALVSSRSTVVGNMEGVPLGYRDRANRLTVKRHYDMFPPETDRERRTLQLLSQQIRLTKTNDDEIVRQRTYVHMFDPANGKVAYGYGPQDPDAIEKVTMFVPGTGTRMNKFDLQMERSERVDAALRSSSEGYNDNGYTVAWLGYRPPARIISGLRRNYAKSGHENLSDSIDGFEAQGQQVALVGHSYGARVSLKAAASHDNVKSVTLVSPPGGTEEMMDGAISSVPGDVTVMMYDEDFLSRQKKGVPRLVEPFLRVAHGKDLTQPREGVNIWRQVGPTPEKPAGWTQAKKASSSTHSAYFYDDNALQTIYTSVLSAWPEREPVSERQIQ